MLRVLLQTAEKFCVEETPCPSPGPDDVVVAVRHCGICGSDLQYIANGGVMGPAEGGMPLGHELAGVIHSVGANIRQFREGDRVCVNPMGAGNAIGNGGPEGGFAQFLLVRNAAAGDAVYHLPRHRSFRDGALVEPLAVGMHAVNRGDLTAGAKVVVFGAGAIGLSCVIALRHKGVDNIIALDYSESRCARALQLGAKKAFSPDDIDLLDTLRAEQGESQVLGGIPAADTDVYIDAAGAAGIVAQVLAVCKNDARLVVAGLHKQAVSVDLMMVLARELSIVGAMAYPDEFPAVLSMLENPDLDLSPMVSHHFPLQQFDEALAQARMPANSAKVMVDMPA